MPIAFPVLPLILFLPGNIIVPKSSDMDAKVLWLMLYCHTPAGRPAGEVPAGIADLAACVLLRLGPARTRATTHPAVSVTVVVLA